MNTQKVLNILIDLILLIGVTIFSVGIMTKIWEICAQGIFFMLIAGFISIIQKINEMEKSVIQKINEMEKKQKKNEI